MNKVTAIAYKVISHSNSILTHIEVKLITNINS